MLKLVLIESNSFEREDEDGGQLGFDPEQAVLNEAELYYGPLASLQGVVVPHCHGLFVASTEYDEGGIGRCYLIVWLDSRQRFLGLV